MRRAQNSQLQNHHHKSKLTRLWYEIYLINDSSHPPTAATATTVLFDVFNRRINLLEVALFLVNIMFQWL